MDSLKRILTIMVVILFLIVGGGGLYLASMGGMNHGNMAAQTSGQNQTQNAKSSEVSKEQQDTQNSPKTTGQQDSGSQAPNPTIVQVPVPQDLTEQRLYVEQLKQRLKAINDANSRIAANSGGHLAQSNGGGTQSGQSNMNELHQGFYKLGQDIALMEKTLEDLSEGFDPAGGGTQPQTSANNPYYPNNYFNSYYPYNPYASWQNGAQGQPYYSQPNQGQINQSQPNQGQPGPGNSGTDTQSQHGSQSAQQHRAGTGQLNLNWVNADTLKLVLSLVLLISIVVAIISVIGFILSIFKGRSTPLTGSKTTNVS